MPLEYTLHDPRETVLGIAKEFDVEVASIPDYNAFLTNAVLEEPERMQNYIKMSLHFQKSNPQAALESCDTGIQKCGEHYIFHHAKGMIYEFIGQRDKALEEFKIAIELDDTALESIISLGTICNRHNEPDEAEKYWNMIIEMVPELHVGWFGKARSEYQRGDYERALKHITAAIFCAEIPEYYKSRADIYRSLKRSEEAVLDLERAVSMKPKAETFQALGHAYTESGNRKKVLDALEKFLELQPDAFGDLSYYPSLAVLYAQEGMRNKIIPFLEKGMQATGEPTRVLDLAGRLLTAAGELNLAADIAEKLYTLTMDSRYKMLAQDLRTTGNVQKRNAAIKKSETSTKKTGRNDPCPCGSGQKYKRCCGR
ncbi:MAG: SEC-C domain-containing protein [Candidatus Aenigmarchaeota archaeon]|nr:SEC-C domain-containing protein [Candidatus Aenigmarchaeota archaeon]